MNKSQMEACLALARFLTESGYAFTTVTPASHARVLRRPQMRIARSLRDVFGWSLPFQESDVASAVPANVFEALRSADLLVRGDGQFQSAVRFSTLDDGLFMHSRFPTDSEDAVFFGPDTYKFVDAIVAYLGRRTAPVRRAADICAGAGPGAVAIARRHRAAEVLMVDVNERALSFAKVNAAIAGGTGARPLRSDLLHDAERHFDLIVAHPPYLIDRSKRVYRHGGGALGAALAEEIVRTTTERLAPGGCLLLFTGIAIVDGQDPFRAAVEPMLRDRGLAWTYREVDPDVFGEELEQPPYDGADRIALVVLEATRQ